jgi:hypothetical protein
VRVSIGRAPHTGVPEIVARPMLTHPDCEQQVGVQKSFAHPKLSNQPRGG